MPMPRSLRPDDPLVTPPELVLLARSVIKTAIYDACPHLAKMMARSRPRSIREDRPALELQADALQFLSGRGDPDLHFWAGLAGYDVYAIIRHFLPLRARFAVRFGSGFAPPAEMRPRGGCSATHNRVGPTGPHSAALNRVQPSV